MFYRKTKKLFASLIVAILTISTFQSFVFAASMSLSAPNMLGTALKGQKLTVTAAGVPSGAATVDFSVGGETVATASAGSPSAAIPLAIAEQTVTATAKNSSGGTLATATYTVPAATANVKTEEIWNVNFNSLTVETAADRLSKIFKDGASEMKNVHNDTLRAHLGVTSNSIELEQYDAAHGNSVHINQIAGSQTQFNEFRMTADSNVISVKLDILAKDFNTLKKFSVVGNTATAGETFWLPRAVLTTDGKLKMESSGTDFIPVSINTWYTLEYVIDMEKQTVACFVDGVYLGGGEILTPITSLHKFSLQAGTDSSKGTEYWADNFCVTKYEPNVSISSAAAGKSLAAGMKALVTPTVFVPEGVAKTAVYASRDGVTYTEVGEGAQAVTIETYPMYYVAKAFDENGTLLATSNSIKIEGTSKAKNNEFWNVDFEDGYSLDTGTYRTLYEYGVANNKFHINLGYEDNNAEIIQRTGDTGRSLKLTSANGNKLDVNEIIATATEGTIVYSYDYLSEQAKGENIIQAAYRKQGGSGNYDSWVTVGRSETGEITICALNSDSNYVYTGITPEIGKWHNYMLMIDIENSKASLYIDQIFAGEKALLSGIEQVYKMQTSFTAVGTSYIDNILVYDNAELSLNPSSYTVIEDKVYGYEGLTAGEMISKAGVPGAITVKILQSDKTTVVADNAYPSKGMILSLSDGINTMYYTLESPNLVADELSFTVDGATQCEKYVTGAEIGVSVDVTNYVNRNIDVRLILAEFDGERPVKIKTSKVSCAKGETPLNVTLTSTDTEDGKMRAYLWSETDMKPLTEIAEISVMNDTDITDVTMLYPGFREKAITFSYDDWIPAEDAKFIGMLDNNGLKGTFNIVTSFLYSNGAIDTNAVERSKNIYKNHEVISHSYTHPRMYLVRPETFDGVVTNPMTYDQVVADIRQSMTDMKTMFGTDCQGFVWPYLDPVERSDYNDILTAMKEMGIKYVRPTTERHDFKLPENWYEWKTTCHHDNIDLYLDKFLALPEDGELDLMFVWGHTREFNASYQPDATNKIRWDDMEERLEKIGARDDVWAATNTEIYTYVEATKAAVVDYNNDTITNNTDQTLYLRVNGAAITIPAHSTFAL